MAIKIITSEGNFWTMYRKDGVSAQVQKSSFKFRLFIPLDFFYKNKELRENLVNLLAVATEKEVLYGFKLITSFDEKDEDALCEEIKTYFSKRIYNNPVVFYLLKEINYQEVVKLCMAIEKLLTKHKIPQISGLRDAHGYRQADLELPQKTCPHLRCRYAQDNTGAYLNIADGDEATIKKSYELGNASVEYKTFLKLLGETELSAGDVLLGEITDIKILTYDSSITNGQNIIWKLRQSIFSPPMNRLENGCSWQFLNGYACLRAAAYLILGITQDSCNQANSCKRSALDFVGKKFTPGTNEFKDEIKPYLRDMLETAGLSSIFSCPDVKYYAKDKNWQDVADGSVTLKTSTVAQILVNVEHIKNAIQKEVPSRLRFQVSLLQRHWHLDSRGTRFVDDYLESSDIISIYEITSLVGDLGKECLLFNQAQSDSKTMSTERSTYG